VCAIRFDKVKYQEYEPSDRHTHKAESRLHLMNDHRMMYFTALRSARVVYYSKAALGTDVCVVSFPQLFNILVSA
jgi:hypothetical protein